MASFFSTNSDFLTSFIHTFIFLSLIKWSLNKYLSLTDVFIHVYCEMKKKYKHVP